MNETTRTIPRIRLVARIAAVLCLLGAVALLPVMALALPVTTPTPALPVPAANYQVVTLAATDAANPGMPMTSISYQIDSGAVTAYSTLLGNVPVISSYGVHHLTYFATDASGTESPSNVSTVTITDTLAPLTWVTSTGSWPTFDGSAAFTLTSTDNSFVYTPGYGVTAVGSGVASTWYKLNSGAWTSGSSVSSSVLGTNTVQFYSIDSQSNKEATESATFWVKDNAAPVSSTDATTTYTGSATIHLSATDTGGSGVANIYYQLDGTAGDPWSIYSGSITAGAGDHVLTYYAVDNSGNNEAPHAFAFTVKAADVTAPVTSYTGPANGASLAVGSVAHITLTGVDGGSGMAGLHYQVDSGAPVVVTSGLKNGVRAAAAPLFGAPNLGVPGSSHPGGSAATITSLNRSCVAAGCHPSLALPTAGAIDHTGVTSGCVTCHIVVDAPPVVEPATHATHDPSWACDLCHGTSLVGPVMPADNGGTHYLGSEPDHDGVCADCHTFTIASGGGGASTASTITTSFDVSGAGSHTITYWSVDKATNEETPHHVVTFTIQAPVSTIATSLTISKSTSSITLGHAFNLSGNLNGGPGANGLIVVLMVKKPGKSYYSYSSNRATYGATSGGSLWQNFNYHPAAKGTYSFYSTFAGSGLYLPAANSPVVVVTVK